MPFQITSLGLETQTQEEIQAEVLTRLQSEFGATLNTSLQSVSGQWARIVAEILAGYQQQVLGLYQSIDPNSAEGVLLDQRAALTGSVRRGETHSTVTGVLTATGACVVTDGTTVRHDVYQTTWEITGGPYVFLVAGALDANLRAVDPGPLASFAGDPWTITSPIVNLSSWTTPVEDATVGRLIESNPAFRARRIGELMAAGQGPLAAISGAVLRIPGVAWARAFHNPSENPVGTDPDRNIGIPYKQFEVVVRFEELPPSPALRTQISETIWQQQGAGVVSYGANYSEVITDSEGGGQLVQFSRIVELDVYLQITVTTSNADEPILPYEPQALADLLRSTCVARAGDLKVPGRDFRAIDYVGAVTRLIADGEVSGLVSVQCLVSSSLPGITANVVTISIRELADLDTGEVYVTINGTDYPP